MTIYITSDWHFGHKNICGEEGFCKTRRHFKTPEEMNQAIIDAHNSVVTDEDTVYHLGDLSMNMKKKELFHDFLTKLKGQLHLVKGNHDSTAQLKYIQKRNYLLPDGRPKFVIYEVGTRLKKEGKVYYLTHFPLGLGEGRRKLRSICGHIHEEAAQEANVINVGLDSPELPKGHPFGVPLEFSVAVELVEKKWQERSE